MYLVERYLKTLKGYIRTYARPEANMVEEYTMSKMLGYCIEYIQRFGCIRRCVWDDTKDNMMNDEVVNGNGWSRLMSQEFCMWAHNFVI